MKFISERSVAIETIAHGARYLIFSLVPAMFLYVGATAIVHAQQGGFASLPSLSGFDRETRQSIELACIVTKSEGPVPYGACLDQQIASLKGASVIPDLGAFDRETRQSIELACIVTKSEGPVPYGACLDQQIASLKGASVIPDLGAFDRETRQSIELACIVTKSEGPVPYGACLDQQIASLKGASVIPDLGAFDRETRQSIELACIVTKSKGPVPYGACLDRQIASLGRLQEASEPFARIEQTRPRSPATPGLKNTTSPSSRKKTTTKAVDQMSRFTSEKVLRIHRGMSSDKVLELFGAPQSVSQTVCGTAIGKPWPCTNWEYGGGLSGWASFTFSGDRNPLILNNFDVRKP